jgi:hypothetical protein
MKTKFVKLIYIVAAIIIIGLYAWNSMVGFRWPSLYVMTNHIITSKFGFVPRTLIGTVLERIIGTTLYNKYFLWAFILAVAAGFVLYVICMIVKLVAIEQNPLALILFLIFVLSPYTKYYLHEAGYYEQYGYILGILLIEVGKKRTWRVTAPLSAFLALIAALISETNLFLIIPFMFTIPFLQIVEEKEHWFRRTIGLGLMYIPSVFYSLLISLYLVPEWIMYKNIAEHDLYANFTPREDVYWYFVFDRSNEELWGRTLHSIPAWCVIYPLLIVALVAFILWKKDRWLSAMYAVMCIGCGVATYLIVIVAWDLDRYYFCIFMQILFVTLFVLRRYLKKYKLCMQDGIFMGVIFVISLFLNHFRFELFDYAQYLNTLDDMIRTITTFVQT